MDPCAWPTILGNFDQRVMFRRHTLTFNMCMMRMSDGCWGDTIIAGRLCNGCSRGVVGNRTKTYFLLTFNINWQADLIRVKKWWHTCPTQHYKYDGMVTVHLWAGFVIFQPTSWMMQLSHCGWIKLPHWFLDLLPIADLVRGHVSGHTGGVKRCFGRPSLWVPFCLTVGSNWSAP